MGFDGVRRHECRARHFSDKVDRQLLSAPVCRRGEGHSDDLPHGDGMLLWEETADVSLESAVMYLHAHQRLGWLLGAEQVRLRPSLLVCMPVELYQKLKYDTPLPGRLSGSMVGVKLNMFDRLTEEFTPFRRSA